MQGMGRRCAYRPVERLTRGVVNSAIPEKENAPYGLLGELLTISL